MICFNLLGVKVGMNLMRESLYKLFSIEFVKKYIFEHVLLKVGF